MGNFLGVENLPGSSRSNQGSVNKELIAFLKTRNMNQIGETVEAIRDYYPTNSTFDANEFEDAFGLMLEDKCEQFFQLLENNHSLDGEIDLYESLATCVIFCNDDYDRKLEFIFALFDFNKNEVIDKQELVLSNQATIRGLCKIAGIPSPSLKQIEDYSLQIFNQVDSDKGGTISLQEFIEWVKYNWELQDFFLKYGNVQTFENAERRCKEFKFVFEKIFGAVSGPNTDRLNIDLLQPLMEKELKDSLNDGSFQILLEVLKSTSKADCPGIQENYVYKKSYLNVMKSWGAFDATDINKDNKLQIQEIKFLLYAYEGDIPDENRIGFEMEMLDKDKSGYVTRKEWLEYLCMDSSNSQKMEFRSGMKELFQQYDTDNSGKLSKNELFELLKQQLFTYTAIYQAKGGEQLQNYYGMVNSITNEISTKLNGKFEDGQVSWPDFKIFMEKAYTEMENLKVFLNSLK